MLSLMVNCHNIEIAEFVINTSFLNSAFFCLLLCPLPAIFAILYYGRNLPPAVGTCPPSVPFSSPLSSTRVTARVVTALSERGIGHMCATDVTCGRSAAPVSERDRLNVRIHVTYVGHAVVHVDQDPGRGLGIDDVEEQGRFLTIHFEVDVPMRVVVEVDGAVCALRKYDAKSVSPVEHVE